MTVEQIMAHYGTKVCDRCYRVLIMEHYRWKLTWRLRWVRSDVCRFCERKR